MVNILLYITNMQIIIDIVYDKLVTIDIDGIESVYELKRLIYKKKNITIKYQGLKYNSKILKNDVKINNYNILNGDIVRFYTRH